MKHTRPGMDPPATSPGNRQIDVVERKEPAETPPVDSVLIDELADWLMSRALEETPIEALFRGCCERLSAADLPLARGSLGFRTLHPLFRAVTLVWRKDRDVEMLDPTVR